jgi:capsular exopolysaccharide synthesis family protein
VSPNPKIIYLTAIFAALGLAIALITVREMASGKILYRQELEAFTSFPILGEVAYGKGKEAIVIKKGRRTFMAEEFRKLRVSLPFMGIGEGLKKVMVTSSIPGEGKSFIACNLAISLSLTGKKVVLVDFDLNNPSLGKLFDMGKVPGVSEYLSGALPPEKIIRNLEDYPNLSFVPSGALPDNPSELIANGRIGGLLTYLENQFDVIILDTAPVVPVTDAYLLAGFTDATLYVVRHKYTPKAIIKRLDEKNKINSLTNPAIVFNGVKPRGFLKNKFGYGYGYGYIYDYKNNNQSREQSLA